MATTLVDLFRAAASYGADTCCVYRTGVRRLTFTYDEMLHAARVVATVLRQHGVQPGDRVMLLAPNGPAWVWCFFGILLAGGVVVPADMRASSEVVGAIARAAGATLLLRTGMKPGLAGISSLVVEDLFWDILAGKGPAPLEGGHAPQPEDLAELVYTSGTTGTPKGVMLTHRNLLSNLEALDQVVAVAATQSYISVLPQSHIFEQVVGMLTFWRAGARVVYLRAVTPREIFAALAAERPTNLLLVPRLLQLFRQRILHEAEEKHLGAVFRGLLGVAPRLPRGLRRLLFATVHRRFGRQFQYFVVGGAPFPDELHRFWGALGFTVVQGYGLTETAPILTCNTPTEQRLGSVGRSLPGQELTIAPDGEILARGPHVTQGYYQDAEKTAEAFRDGWFRTGDLGELRAGWLYLKGRQKDVIVPAHGINVYAEDVEAAVVALPGVKDVAVIGRKGAGGEEVHAVLLLQPAAPPPADIVRQANATLDTTQQITGFSVWPDEDFPRTATLKVRKFLVAQRLAAEGATVAGPAVAHLPTGQERLYGLIARAADRPIADVRPEVALASDLGLDSVGRLELVALLETELSVDVEEADITAQTTVRDLEALIARRGERQQAFFWAWPFAAAARPLQWLLRRSVVFPLLRLYARVAVQGGANLARLSEPVLYVANHVSAIDTPVILRALPVAARRRIAVFARSDLFEHAAPWKALRWHLYFFFMSLAVPLVVVPQDRGFRKTLAFAGRFADAGFSFLLFPEGRRTEDGSMLPFRSGAGLAAQELALPVVPVKTSGLFEILPRTELWPRRRGTVRVTFGTPFRAGAGTPAEIARRLQEAVANV